MFPIAERWGVARKPKGVYCPSFSRQHIDELIFMYTQYSHLCSATRNAAVTYNVYATCQLLVTTIRITKRQILLIQLALLLYQKIAGNTR